MGRPRKGARVLGPYFNHRRWEIRAYNPEGGCAATSFETETEAKEALKLAREKLPGQGITIKEALKMYGEHQERKGIRERTAKVAASAIRWFLSDEERLMQSISPTYLRQRITKRLEEGKAIDTVASELRTTKTFFRWSAGRGILRWTNRLEAIRVEGRRKKGKPQLTIDEGRRFLKVARTRARKGNDGAIAAICPLLLGIRAREILNRQIRDLDDDGRLLWIRRAKTERGNRRVEIPEELRRWLVRLAGKRAGDEYLFPGARQGRPRATSWLAKQVKELCDAAKVPVVCPHGLRGTHATLAEAAGVTSHVVAASLGHVGPEVTGRHYTQPEVRTAASQRRSLMVLEGGRK